ncbi:MAG: hypothetical protein DHS20C18_12970 [Saprospiraceae bacterium]|nr:MAG: hypothetical protein DHS20C18_12970 [Saprospiraceae bacterium]
MASIIFQQNEQNPRIYIAESQSTDLGWAAFLLPQGADTSSKKYTLAEAWCLQHAENPVAGYLLFTANAPQNLSQFVAQWTTTYGGQTRNAIWIGWLTDADASSFTNENVLILPLTKTAVQEHTKAFFYLTETPVNLQFARFADLAISHNCIVDLSDAADQLRFRFFDNISNITFSTQLATDPLPALINDKVIFLTFDGQTRGCFQFDLVINNQSSLQAYAPGFRYYYPNAENPDQIQHQHYPLFTDIGKSAGMKMAMSLDPIDPFNSQYPAPGLRTYLAFTGQNKDNVLEMETVLPSNLRTSLGKQLLLTPKVDFLPDTRQIPSVENGLLVFSPGEACGTTEAGYLVPQGSFYLGLDAIPAESPTVHNLLCGLSGLETATFIPKLGNYLGDRIIFQPKGAAFAPVFPIPNGGEEASSKPLLNDQYRTSYASIVPSDNRPVAPTGKDYDNRYLSQPKGASLYNINELSQETDTPFLGFYEPTAAKLTTGEAPIYFPLACYGSFNQEEMFMLQYEVQILNPARKNTIEKAYMPQLLKQAKLSALRSQSNQQDQTELSTTPQGLMVEVDQPTSHWSKLILAKNYTGGNSNKPGPPLTLQFQNLSARLRSAFQTNQQFLVISLDKENSDDGNKPILGEFDNEIQMEGWPFKVNVPQENTYGQFNNVLIFKFCEGSLYDRVQNPKKWTNSTDFNETGTEGLGSLSSWLTNYVKDGIGKKNDPDFQYFAQIVQDENWNGILALKTDIGLDNFPKELQGLLAGIDLSRFNAHHFGININKVQPQKIGDKLGLSMDDKSSMFGLIYYVDPLFAPFGDDLKAYKEQLVFNDSKPYDFKTLTLKVLFENAKIKSFQSYIQLSIYQLFGNGVSQTPSRDNILILSGSYENHNGAASYSFNGTGDDLIPVKNPVFNGVEVLKSNFRTLVSSDQVQNPNQVTAQFALWGYLNFKPLKGIDLLSFGSDEGAFSANQGLSYSQLIIQMDFNLQTPAVKNFSFHINEITFDIATSQPRAASLYNHFPIQLTTLISGTKDNAPTDQSFVAISTPNLQGSGSISGDWFGLVFDFNLGTPGALGSKLGFKSSLIIAWNVTGGSVFTGIQLPGLSSKAKLLSIQGVLKLNIGSIKLLKAEKEGQPEATAYLLMMNNIAMKFLSKQFPSSGSIDFFLFGDPNNDAKPSSMGWYAAYNKKKKSPEAVELLSSDPHHYFEEN